VECNLANLIINHGWTALLIDGNLQKVNIAQNFYHNLKSTKFWPPQIVHAWVTAENVNGLIESEGFIGEIDLLSLDMDGVDFWVWQALSGISPRVVVLEYNHLLGPSASLTVPYDPDFVGEFSEHGSDYSGASLAAFVNLGKKKGYRYVGANVYGTNAFFVREDVAGDHFPVANLADAFTHPRARYGMKVRYLRIKGKKWIEV
jgi:hypothetical protein